MVFTPQSITFRCGHFNRIGIVSIRGNRLVHRFDLLVLEGFIKISSLLSVGMSDEYKEDSNEQNAKIVFRGSRSLMVIRRVMML